MRPQLSQPESDSMSSAGDKHGLTTRILFNCVMLHRHVYRSFMTRLNTVRFNILVASDQCLTSHFIEFVAIQHALIVIVVVPYFFGGASRLVGGQRTTPVIPQL